MIDQAERLRELEIENEKLLATLETVYDARKENEVLREAMHNIGAMVDSGSRSWREVRCEIATTQVKLQVLEESN